MWRTAIHNDNKINGNNNGDNDNNNNNNNDDNKVFAAMENFVVNEAGAAWSGLLQAEEDHVIMLYQLGSTAAGVLVLLTSYAHSGQVQDSSLGHSELPPPSKAVYKEPGKDLHGSVLN